MYLSVRDMETRKVHFDLAFLPGEIDFLDQTLRQSSALKVAGSAELLGTTHEIRVTGRLTVRMSADCDRCLEEAAYPLEQDFDLFYRPAPLDGAEEERELEEGAAQLGSYEGGGLELKEILCEQVLLALPMQRVCRPDCKGICPVCGQNRNQVQCDCRARPADSRWAALKNWE